MADTDELSLEAALAPDPPADETGETSTNVDTSDEPETATEEEAATPAEPEKKTDEEPWHVKAVMSEREKRQAAERERDELRKKLEAQQEAEPKTSVFEDEAKWRQEFDQDIDLRVQNIRYDISQRLAEKEFGAEKVNSAMEAFKSLVQEDQSLGKEVFDDSLPYFKMIEIVERQEKAKQLESLSSDDYREKLEAELREKLLKEMEAEAQAKEDKRKGIAPSLASARSSGKGTETSPEPTEPTVEDMYPD